MQFLANIAGSIWYELTSRVKKKKNKCHVIMIPLIFLIVDLNNKQFVTQIALFSVV